MAKASDITEQAVVSYAPHEFDPLDSLDFIQLDGFTKGWSRLKLTAEDGQALRVMIAAAPSKAPVISGTGGLRKFRFTTPRMNRGKSGALRVCYAYFQEHGIVLLVRVYGKSQKDNLTKQECNGIKKLLMAFEKSLEQKPLH